MRVSTLLCALIASVWCLVGVGSVQAQDKAPEKCFPVVTGQNWKNSTPEEKLAFIAGMTTIIELEKEVQGPDPQGKSLIPGWVKGLSKYKLKDIVAALDDYFAKKPDQLDRPVVEVLWVEVAEPNMIKK
ncbi:hypothetical protein JCM15519_00890 [Fundidesulfovibrio butyratiphilus]